ncbi:MAG: cation transporter [Candidatus Desulfofervidaceae bacterium]|nr:cation transporter [Candidatus Desulfofervidaceae bacterium]
MSLDYTHTIRRLNLSVAFNFLITLAEFIGGILTGSLSLLADALHNLTDTFSIFISLIAYKISLRAPDTVYTYGYRRVGILAGLLNLGLLFGISLFLLKEGISRLFHPQVVDTKLMLIIACIGLIANILSGLLLFKDAQKSLNIKAAFFHILADAFSSIGVILAGVTIYFTHFYAIDTIFCFIIAAYLIYASVGMARQILPILMQSVPSEYDLKKIAKAIEELEGVEDIHHLHLWALDEYERYFECHVEIKEENLDRLEEIKRLIKEVLSKQFGIYHSTLEFEVKGCEDKSIVNKHQKLRRHYH